MTRIPKDDDGQPIHPFPASLIQNQGKLADQLVGLCKGILMDGIVNAEEARGFRSWINNCLEREPGFPFDQIKQRLDAFSDGKPDEVEREEMAAILKSIVGAEFTNEDTDELSMELPLCDPPPPIIYPGREFVVTGRCAFGTRAKVWEAITSRGGLVNETPRSETSFLLIGHFASRDWAHTNYGRKIERAVELRDATGNLHIIGEEHWMKSL